MKRQTFVLPQHALDELRQLAQLTSIPQSRLLEVAISDMMTEYQMREDKETFCEVIRMATSGRKKPGPQKK
jgi:hypothetical protein